MTLKWEKLSGYRAQIKIELPPPGVVVYTSNSTMVQINPLPSLTAGMTFCGDISSSNVIVVGKGDHFILAGAVTAFRSLTMLRAVYDRRRIVAVEVTSGAGG